MSISSEITRISGNVSDALTAIRAKGVTVPSGATSDSLADLINAIPQNLVTGEFTAQSTAGVQSINIPYTGNGYPIAAMVYVKGGMYNNTASGQSDWYNSLTRYNVGQWTMHKAVQDVAPAYGSTTTSENQATVTSVFKNSASAATTYSSGSSKSAIIFTSSNPSTSSNGVACVRFSNKNTMNVYSATSATYGLMAGITYKYHVIYSE